MTTVGRSLMLSMVDSYFALVVQIASTMIIARLLTPHDVGIFAVAAVFSALASTFRDFGVAEYMIQEKELSPQRISSALALNILTSWTMAGALFVGGPLAAKFYSNPGIADVMHVQALSFMLVPFGAVTMAYFRRELNYAPILICNVAGTATSFVVAVSLAFTGFGYMSLAWASLAGIAVTVAGSLWLRPAHFPVWPGFTDFGIVFNYSKFASLIYIVGQLGKGAPEMIIGRALGMVDVAMFSRANGLVELFNRLLVRSVLQVCMPYFAQSDRAEGSIAKAYLKSVSYLTAVGWPFLCFVGVAAFSAIRIIYGPQWNAAVPLARILCAACALELLSVLSREALLACGHAREANTLQLRQQLLVVVGLLAVVPFGLLGAAWGVFGASAIGILLAQSALSRFIGLRARDVARACISSGVLCVGSVAPVALWTTFHGVVVGDYLTFGIAGAVVTLISWLICLHMVRHPLVHEIADVCRRARTTLRLGT